MIKQNETLINIILFNDSNNISISVQNTDQLDMIIKMFNIDNINRVKLNVGGVEWFDYTKNKKLITHHKNSIEIIGNAQNYVYDINLINTRLSNGV